MFCSTSTPSVSEPHSVSCCINSANEEAATIMGYEQFLCSGNAPKYFSGDKAIFVQEGSKIKQVQAPNETRVLLINNASRYIDDINNPLREKCVHKLKNDGFLTYEQNCIENIFGLTASELEILRNILNNSVNLADKSRRFQARSTISLIYCKFSNRGLVFFNDLGRKSDNYTDDCLSFLAKFVCQALPKLSDKPCCLNMTIQLNIHLFNDERRLLWHQDNFPNNDWTKVNKMSLLQTALLKTTSKPLTPQYLELGLINSEYLVNPEGELENYQFQNAKGKAEIGDSGQIITLSKQQNTDDKTVIYLLAKLLETEGAGYEILQDREYDYEKNRYQVVHSNTGINGNEINPECNTDAKLVELLKDSENIVRELLVVRVVFT